MASVYLDQFAAQLAEPMLDEERSVDLVGVAAVAGLAVVYGVAVWLDNGVVQGSSAWVPPDQLSRSDYPGVFGDPDADSIPSVDDPNPLQPGDVRSVEEVRLSDQVGALIDLREDYVDAKNQTMAALQQIVPGATVLGRVKAPYSMINKLRRKRLRGPKGITDIAGAMIVVNDQDQVERAKRAILSGKLGQVLEHEDFYRHPQSGYRAHHFTLVRPGSIPIEVQLKTHRMKKISDASHTPYKMGKLDVEQMQRLTELAYAADRGERAAAAQLDPLLANGSVDLARVLTR